MKDREWVALLPLAYAIVVFALEMIATFKAAQSFRAGMLYVPGRPLWFRVLSGLAQCQVMRHKEREEEERRDQAWRASLIPREETCPCCGQRICRSK